MIFWPAIIIGALVIFALGFVAGYLIHREVVAAPLVDFDGYEAAQGCKFADSLSVKH